MIYTYSDQLQDSQLQLILSAQHISRKVFADNRIILYTILWNRGAGTVIDVDGVHYPFPSGHMLCLMVNQSFEMAAAGDIVSWQFNREFYCIVDHDQEVSCVGFLFYGAKGVFFIALGTQQLQIEQLLEVFKDEFETADNIQGEMLRMLLKRLIIKLTRLAREQQLDLTITTPQLDIVRQFNLLVELHFRRLHQVQDYAKLMHRSPKTLSNLFALYNSKSPLLVIQERILLEAKRLLQYTDKTATEIAHELGFEEPSHFSRFFKKMSGMSPSAFKP